MSDFSALLPKAIEGLVHEAANTAVAKQQEALRPLLARIDDAIREVRYMHAESTAYLQKTQAEIHVIRQMLEHLLNQDRPCGGVQYVIGAIKEVSERVANGNLQNRAGFEDVRALAKVYADRLEAKLKPGVSLTDPSSNVPSEKLIAYLATEYCLGYSADDIILKIGVQNPRLAEALEEFGVTCGAFITAYNPEGTQQSNDANARDHAALRAEVVALGLAFIEGEGADATGAWPAERSVFAYGMDKATACRIGRQFRQDAIVWVGSDAVPQLVLLR